MKRTRKTVATVLIVLGGIAFILGLAAAVSGPRLYTNSYVAQSGEWLKHPQPHEMESAGRYIGMELRSLHRILRALNWSSCLHAASALLFMVAAITSIARKGRANTSLHGTHEDARP